MTFLDDDPENAEFWDNLGGYTEVRHAYIPPSICSVLFSVSCFASYSFILVFFAFVHSSIVRSRFSSINGLFVVLWFPST